MKLENRLKELRARDRLNQTELAKKAGVSRQTVSLIERGEYAPSVIIALKIANIFGENVENVFYLKENSDEKIDENYRFTSSEYFARNFCSKQLARKFPFSNFFKQYTFRVDYSCAQSAFILHDNLFTTVQSDNSKAVIFYMDNIVSKRQLSRFGILNCQSLHFLKMFQP